MAHIETSGGGGNYWIGYSFKTMAAAQPTMYVRISWVLMLGNVGIGTHGTRITTDRLPGGNAFVYNDAVLGSQLVIRGQIMLHIRMKHLHLPAPSITSAI